MCSISLYSRTPAKEGIMKLSDVHDMNSRATAVCMVYDYSKAALLHVHVVGACASLVYHCTCIYYVGLHVCDFNIILCYIHAGLQV